MAQFSFTGPDGKKFSIKGPESLTEAQALEIFNKQADTGALVGLKPGDLLNSAQQALGGVKGALGSALSSLTGGASGALSGALGSLTGGASGALSGALGSLTGGASGALTGVIGSITGAASTAVSGIASSLTSGLPSAPINLGDLAKSTQGVASMAGLSPQAVTAGLSSVQNLVNQPASILSDAKGLGSFGLGIKQLEVGGFVKPGTSNLLDQAGATVSKILKSPTVWTGKAGISSAKHMLDNPPLQSLTQQNLMSTGLSGLGSLGVPTDALNPQAAIGAALNAAKSIPGAAAWAKGVSLPTDIKSAFDSTAVAGAFGVNLSDLKANAPMLAEEKIKGSLDTVNRDTLNAATQRLLGGAKIPKLSYAPPTSVTGALDALKGGASGALGGALGSITGAATGALGSITGAATGALDSLTGGATGAISGAVSSATSAASGAINGAVSSATSAASGAVAGLTGSLSNF
jgi:hypothetical protein